MCYLVYTKYNAYADIALNMGNAMHTTIAQKYKNALPSLDYAGLANAFCRCAYSFTITEQLTS